MIKEVGAGTHKSAQKPVTLNTNDVPNTDFHSHDITLTLLGKDGIDTCPQKQLVDLLRNTWASFLKSRIEALTHRGMEWNKAENCRLKISSIEAYVHRRFWIWAGSFWFWMKRAKVYCVKTEQVQFAKSSHWFRKGKQYETIENDMHLDSPRNGGNQPVRLLGSSSKPEQFAPSAAWKTSGPSTCWNRMEMARHLATSHWKRVNWKADRLF